MRSGLPGAATDAASVQAAGKPIGVIRAIARTIILALLILASGTINTYITQYMTTYTENTLHVAPILFSPPQL